MFPTLTHRRNVLAELVDELEREGTASKRRADQIEHNARTAERSTTTSEDHRITYARAVQDAHANIVGRLRNILAAPLSTIVDVGEVFDAVEAALGAHDATSSTTTVTPHTAARIAAEVIDGRNVGGAR